MSSFFIQGKGNSSGARVHPRTNRIVQKKKKETAAAVGDFLLDSVPGVGAVRQTTRSVERARQWVAENFIDPIKETAKKVQDVVTSIPKKIKQEVDDAISTVTDVVSSDEFNEWFDDIETPDETANQIAQANAQAANEFTAEQNRLAREWNEEMYNTRYQRTYADMKAAGINPVIGLASMGVGSVPTASGATGVSAQSYMREPNLLDQVIPVVRLISSLVSAVTRAKR